MNVFMDVDWKVILGSTSEKILVLDILRDKKDAPILFFPGLSSSTDKDAQIKLFQY